MRQNTKVRRALSFALIPLSVVPFVAAVPLVAPAVEQRLDRPAARSQASHPRVDEVARAAERERRRTSAADARTLAGRVTER